LRSFIPFATATLAVLVLAPSGEAAQEPPESITYTQFMTGGPEERDPDWSPDGKWISYSIRSDGQSDIWIKPLDGGDAIRVTEDPADDRIARWSPDGSKLLFWSERTGSVNIWTVSPFEGKETLFQDGETIIFHSNKTGTWGVWTVPSSGGVAEHVVDWPSNTWGPSCHPTGKNSLSTPLEPQPKKANLAPSGISGFCPSKAERLPGSCRGVARPGRRMAARSASPVTVTSGKWQLTVEHPPSCSKRTPVYPYGLAGRPMEVRSC
jgi:dipeptidyl aminopeptidase/acylaminoacyl peptidase